MRSAIVFALVAALSTPVAVQADTSKPVVSGLRGVRVAAMPCNRVTGTGNHRAIVGTVRSIRVCPLVDGMRSGGTAITLSATKRSVAFRAMRAALTAADGIAKPGQMCAMYADVMRLVYVVTTKGTWLAHLPVDGCHHYTRAVTAALELSAPTALDPIEAALARTEAFGKTLIGMTEAAADAAATKAGYTTRVVSREPGDSILITMDLRSDRVNLTLRNGIVTETRAG